MADSDAGEVIGAIFMIILVVVAVAVATAVVVVLGSLIGTGVGLVNYCKAFNANVRPEGPPMS
jgi:hypothetical protein